MTCFFIEADGYCHRFDSVADAAEMLKAKKVDPVSFSVIEFEGEKLRLYDLRPLMNPPPLVFKN